MNLIEKIKAIETYVCENFEELGLDDPVEEEYFSAYEEYGRHAEHKSYTRYAWILLWRCAG